MGDDDPETPCAVSYYLLYSSKRQEERNEEETRKVPEERALFWEDDEWTEEELRAAAAELAAAAAAERGQPPMHRTAKRDGNGDETHHREAWNAFYRNHGTRFFKDRHYLPAAFPEEFAGAPAAIDEPVQQKCLVEIGCGVGNTLLPLLEDDRGGGGGGDDARNKGGNRRDRIQWTVHGWDVSSVAIDHLRRDGRFRRAAARGRAHAHVCDVSSGSGVPPCVCAREAADVTTLLFCLSAVDPDHHGAAARRAAGTLKPGGVLVFRDYGRFDRAQFQLARQRNKLVGQVASDSGGTSPCYFYRKHDGTHCLYFSVEYVRELFAEVAGLEELDCRYLERRYTNRSQGAVRRRVWVQARFRKPANGTVRPSMDTWQVPMKAP